MADKSGGNKPIKRRDNDNKILDAAIKSVFPTKTSQEIREIRSKVIEYISKGLVDGFDIALIKQQDGNTILKVLKLVEKRRGGRFLGNKNDETGG